MQAQRVRRGGLAGSAGASTVQAGPGLGPGGSGASAILPQPTQVVARTYHGQTFVIWLELAGAAGESYRVYRHDKPITAATFPQATLLYEVAEGSSAWWSDYWNCGVDCATPGEFWEPRFSATMPLPPAAGEVGTPASPDRGMLVWTLGLEDFLSGSLEYYYAVTTVDAQGDENVASFGPANTFGPLTETLAPRRPLRIDESVDADGNVRRVYVQYMDLRTFNPTLTAPNAVQGDYGQDLQDPAVARSIQYAFSYVVIEPPVDPADYPLPVVLKLHPYLADTLAPPEAFLDSSNDFQLFNYYDYPAIEIRPIDVGSTWWFGFAAEGFDYREFANECEAIDAMVQTAPDVANHTEERLLRMVFDLVTDGATFQGKVDPDRVYVAGHSMGGGGAVALALRYPNVFAASYATAPVTDFRRLVNPAETCPDPSIGWPADPNCALGFQYDLAYDVALKWGPTGTGDDPTAHIYPGVCAFPNPPGHAQAVQIRGPAGLAKHLAPYAGTPVYDWNDHGAMFPEMAERGTVPLSFRHSSADRLVNWRFQGKPFYGLVNQTNSPWAGLVDDGLEHLIPWWFLGLSSNYKEVPGQGPFFGLQARRSETVPGLRFRTGPAGDWIFPPPLVGFHSYGSDFPLTIADGASIEWSSSWNPWRGDPIDTATEWEMWFRTTNGSRQFVDVTPRRLQNFVVVPGATYSWSLINAAGVRVKCGCVEADENGNLTIEVLPIGGLGKGLRIEPGIDQTCLDCIVQPASIPDDDKATGVGGPAKLKF